MEIKMKKQLLIATTAAALIAGSSMGFAQSPTAPQGSAEKAASDVKQAPRVGDSTSVGGTPSSNMKARERDRGPLTENGAPVGSPAQQADTQKQAQGSGDSTKTGGTTTGDMNAMQKQSGPKSINGAPIGSSANKADEVKQAPRTGDSTQVGGPAKSKM